ncbi:MAG: DNA repair protein RecN [Bacteroidetes bacterium RIFCSPLOWO2_12_FULL_31_6]|nr:MAG: DNA repair protein RecN [Bacteroidetes bacterium RIFCSPLOWO2_12_FULL_31_6]
MLLHLSITNYAIIEKLDIDFNNGFTVITGETGAGKSILLGALSLILGNRVDTGVLNDKEKKCVVEGVFKLAATNFQDFFKENDLDFEEETTIRREISSLGKSRAFINDTPVNLNVVKDLAEQLINIHSQHQNLLVKNGNYQLTVVDSYAGILSELEDYEASYKIYQLKKNELVELKNKESKANSEIDFIKFQLNELEVLKLQENEQQQLEEQLDLLNNAEEIKSTLHQANSLLLESEENILRNIKIILQSFSKIAHLSNDYQLIYDRLNTLLIELDDVAREISRFNENVNFDSGNSEYLSNRLNNIYTIEKKHQVTNSNDLLSLLTNFKQELAKIESIEDVILDLEKEVLVLEKELFNKAKDISNKRTKSIPKLTQSIQQSLLELGLPHSNFIIKQQVNNELKSTGIDKIEFLFSANKGFEPEEINKIASGGEISRVMLTIKSILAKSKNLSTVVFDEIDTGVSGDIADKMGNIMKQMSNDIQIITITHLPQVAAKGTHHFRIFKEVKGDKTITDIEILDQEGKINEVAKMLSGKELTKAALENAKNLISN